MSVIGSINTHFITSSCPARVIVGCQLSIMSPITYYYSAQLYLHDIQHLPRYQCDQPPSYIKERLSLLVNYSSLMTHVQVRQ